jgi:hypothetical protein
VKIEKRKAERKEALAKRVRCCGVRRIVERSRRRGVRAMAVLRVLHVHACMARTPVGRLRGSIVAIFLGEARTSASNSSEVALTRLLQPNATS